MTEIEQLRADMATLKETSKIYLGAYGYFPAHHDLLIKQTKEKIADLEAQQEQVDPWQTAKKALSQWESVDSLLNSKEKRAILAYVRNLQAKVDELNDELRCERIDGGKVRDDLKARIAEMEQHGRKVDQANHEHYGRLQDQIAIRDLKIEKLERQAPAERNRENLAELVTIQNVIPPACGIFFYSEQFRETLELARELVEKRIEGVKKEMQGNG